MKIETKESIWNGIFILGLIMLFLSLGLIINEFYGSVSYCHHIENGDYSYSYPNHYCNGIKIFQYSDGWNYEKLTEIKTEINLTD